MANLVYNPYIAPLICTAVCFSSPKICGGVNSPRTRPFAKLLLEHISSLDMTYTYHRPSTNAENDTRKSSSHSSRIYPAMFP